MAESHGPASSVRHIDPVTGKVVGITMVNLKTGKVKGTIGKTRKTENKRTG